MPGAWPGTAGGQDRPQQRVVRGRRQQVDPAHACLQARAATLHPSAGGQGQQLRTQADAERRQIGGRGAAQQGAGGRQPGRGVVVPGGHGPAEHEQAVVAGGAGVLRESLAPVRPHDVEDQAGQGARERLDEPSGTGTVLVLDAQDPGHSYRSGR